MRSRILPVLAAGALVLSSLLGPSAMSQADEPTASPGPGSTQLLPGAKSLMGGATAVGSPLDSDATASQGIKEKSDADQPKALPTGTDDPVEGTRSSVSSDLASAATNDDGSSSSLESSGKDATSTKSSGKAARGLARAAAGTWTVEGTITPVDAPGAEVTLCSMVESDGWFTTDECSTQSTDDGTYSFIVEQGQTVAVQATAEGYFTTYAGGLVSRYSFYAGDDRVEKITEPTEGDTVVRNLDLVERVSASGAVTLPDGFTWSGSGDNGWVAAYQVVTTDGVLSLESASEGSIKDDGSFIIDWLLPGREYVVATNRWQLYTEPSASGLMTTTGGGYAVAEDSLGYDYDLSDPTLGVFATPADGTPVTGKDITVKVAPTLTGTIAPADAPNVRVYGCTVAPESPGYCDLTPSGTVNDDGTFSIPVSPGVEYRISASADGYVETWLGGGTGAYADDDTQTKTVVTSPKSGDKAVGAIDLVQGVIVTGTVTPVTGMTDMVNVCAVTSDNNPSQNLDCHWTYLNAEGKYSATVPADTNVVVSTADSHEGYLTTWYGQHAGEMPDVAEISDLPEDLTVFNSGPAGGTVTGKDITRVKAASISGKVILPPGHEFVANDMAQNGYVFTCEVDRSGDNPTTTNCTNYARYVIQDDGSYTLDGLLPSQEYVVYVAGSFAYYGVSAEPADLLTTAYGQYSRGYGDLPEYFEDFEGIDVVTTNADSSDKPGIDITMVQGATVSGKVTADDATAVGVSMCLVHSSDTGPFVAGNCTYSTVGEDGAYSTVVDPGSTVVVYAQADGYLYTYYGGYFDTDIVYNLPVGGVTQIDTTGKTSVPNIDIDLKKGASMSGKVILPAGYEFVADEYGQYGSVSVHGVDELGRSLGGYVEAQIDATGAYSVDGLYPGRSYVAYAESNTGYYSSVNTAPAGLLTTAHGGYATLGTYLPSDIGDYPTIVAEKTNTDGTVKAGVDILMVKGLKLSGEVTPSDADNVSLRLCEYVENSGSMASPHLGACVNPSVGEDGSYSTTVVPDSTIVTYAKADGYLYTWHGGHADTDSNVTLPADGVTLVDTTGKTSVDDVDISLAKAAILSGQVTWPEGYTPDESSYAVYGCVVDRSVASNAGALECVSAPMDSEGFYSFEALPGTEYLVYSSGYYFDPRGLLTTTHGGYATWNSTPQNTLGLDFADPALGLVRTPVSAAPVENIDIAMTEGAFITGAVYLPDGSTAPLGENGYSVANVTLVPVNEDGSRAPFNAGDWYSNGVCSVDENGVYTCVAYPGATYSIYATVAGYPLTWLGDVAGDAVLPQTGIDQVTAAGSGETTSGKDIHLAEGSTISGELILSSADEEIQSARVTACAVLSDNSLSDDCREVRLGGSNPTGESADGGLNSDGTWTIKGIAPGKSYVVSALATTVSDGVEITYTQTWHGQYAGAFGALPQDGVTQFTSAAAGEDVTGIDITLVKAMIITGKVSPQSVVDDTGLVVYACRVSEEGAQRYYSTGGGQGCYPAVVVSDSDGTYSIPVAPGDYVVVGDASGYTDAWHGGYSAESGIYEIDYVSGPVGQAVRELPDALIPPTDLIAVVSGAAGETKENIDIVFGDAVIVTFDADGGTPATQAVMTADGSAVSLPSEPTKAGYDFAGWFTEKNGGGTQLTEATLVHSDMTVYAKWGAEGSVPPTTGPTTEPSATPNPSGDPTSSPTTGPTNPPAPPSTEAPSVPDSTPVAPTVPGATASQAAHATKPKAPTGGMTSSDHHNMFPLLVAMGVLGAAGVGCLRLKKHVSSSNVNR